MDGLSVPSGLVPAWAAPLVPTALDIDVKFQMNDLDKIAHAAIASIDLRPNQSPDVSKLAVIEAMAMSGEPKLTLAPGHISSPSLDLYFHGEMALVPKPMGTLTLEAEGLDKALSRLQEAAKSNPAASAGGPRADGREGSRKAGRQWPLGLGRWLWRGWRGERQRENGAARKIRKSDRARGGCAPRERARHALASSPPFRKALFPSAPWHDTQLRQFHQARAIREGLCFFKLHGSRS